MAFTTAWVMQIKDASCGWNLMSLKRCWVNFILPRERERNEIWLNAIKTAKVCGWRAVCGAQAEVYVSSLKSRKGGGCNETTEIQGLNWVNICELPELIGAPLKPKGNWSNSAACGQTEVCFVHCFHSCIHFYLCSFNMCHPTIGAPFNLWACSMGAGRVKDYGTTSINNMILYGLNAKDSSLL